jgi:subtilisin family serine protease
MLPGLGADMSECEAGKICVGAVCDRDEETLALFPPGLSDLTPFSNSGPTRDGRPSPDLTAAGVKLTIGGSTVDRGTSYSTPIVTGVVARMLASNPQLTVTEVRGLLTSTAVLPKTVEGADERGYHPHAGFGELSGAGLLKKGAIVV